MKFFLLTGAIWLNIACFNGFAQNTPADSLGLQNGVNQADTVPVTSADSAKVYVNSLEAGFRYEAYEPTYSDRTYFYLQYGRKIKRVDLFGRIIRYAFAQNVGYQFETEAYWKFKRNGYSYFDAAYSNATIFPNYRLRAELFRNYKQLEYSLGVGLMKPHNFKEIPLITGTLGYYFSNYFVFVRPTFSYVDNGFSNSIYLNARRYFSKTDYAGIAFLKGSDTGTSRNINAIANSFGLDTYLVRVNGQVVRGRYKFGAGLDYGGIFIPERDEYAEFIGIDIFINRAF
jgi:YaiO family outer membrane protein